MIAVVPVTKGHLPPGGDEAVAEANDAGGRALLVGSGVAHLVDRVAPMIRSLILGEAGDLAPRAWARALADVVTPGETVVLPASADGLALAPHLAVAAGRRLLGPVDRAPDDGSVVLLAPGSRSVIVADEPDPDASVIALHLSIEPSGDAELTRLIPADPATVELASAERMVAGGAGLDSPDELARLGEAGLRVGASLGATRVLTDAGWLDHARQIGTTGAMIDPDLYIAVGISGAVQHLMGIGQPDRVISVNTDPSCPMMGRADLALVTDGPGYVAELARLLVERGTND